VRRGRRRSRFGPMSPAFRGPRWSSRQNDWNVIYAPFAAAMSMARWADAVRIYRETASSSSAAMPAGHVLYSCNRFDGPPRAVRQEAR